MGTRIQFACRKVIFDRRFTTHLERANLRALGKAAFAVAQTAKRSMLSVAGPSPAGSPPHAHKKKPKAIRGGPLLKQLLYYDYDLSKKPASVVIGPMALAAGTGAGPRTEFGGTATGKNRARRRYKIGDRGPIRIGGPKSRTTRTDRIGKKEVTFATLRTDAQVRAANNIDAALHGPRQQTRRYPRRPFMLPALMLNRSRLASHWRGELKNS